MDAEILAAVSAYSASPLDPQEWQSKANDLHRRQRLGVWRRRLARVVALLRRTQESVGQNYDSQWTNRPVEGQVIPSSTTVPCLWRDRQLLLNAVGTKRVHLLFLMRIIDRLAPQSVLEVGAGNGLNLLLLAARFTGIPFAGIELTQSGVDAARRIAQSAWLPKELVDFAPEPLPDVTAVRQIDFRQGDARKLPFRDGEFDLVFTCLALEQMEEIRDAALREIARVARRHVVMVEPFAEFNNEGLRRDYVYANDYFRGAIADLPRLGLDPVYVNADIPHKLNLKPAVVVARKA